MSRFLVVVLGLLTFAASALPGARAQAEPMPVVVELFTSQGCSSCPPADALLKELGARDDIIALALHVDYWDYIGWKDRFAQPEFTQRQRGYARAGGWGVIYTPQIVVNGSEDVVGSRPERVRDLLTHHAKRDAQVTIALTRGTDGALRIEARPLGDGGPWDIHIVRYTPGKTVKITKGENRGRTFDYGFIATDWDMAARWSGKAPFIGDVPMVYDQPVVVLVQEPDYGEIVGAARLR
ncbi:thioredoxin family protein [Cognatishimia sp. F0-27]|uniref:DUF1223 domain-containing protein n=1 Tax=Cognatishimia sp. F0-27 TaxID=2816855 RepID=UPI001D0CA3C0|nr:DUF1223 domain-containing protein [Cognatishimia sp. F0-27]MCC1492582.1 DUF1223 domain-containing protein [Cognatishimia sp. F0-27]